MKMLLDPSHLEMPFHVAASIGGIVAGVAISTWQGLGSVLSQIPVTPDQMTGWQEKYIYLWAAIAATTGLVFVLRWIATKWLISQADNTEAMKLQAASNNAVAEALTGLKNSINGIALSAVQKAVMQAVPDPHPQQLGTAPKRSRQPPPDAS
jgi:hypothetical protein